MQFAKAARTHPPRTGARRHPGLVDRVVEHVFGAVIEGQWPPGTALTEDEIAADFGASRTPVREAVRRLAEMGVLVVRPRCGLEVASFDEEDLRQITALRAEMECFALRMAMNRMGTAEVEALAAAAADCDAQFKRSERVDVFRADSRFHLLLAEFSGNSHLVDTLRRLDVKVQLCRMVFCASLPKIRESVREHRALLEAIRAKQPAKAEAVLREHILQSVRLFQAKPEARA